MIMGKETGQPENPKTESNLVPMCDRKSNAEVSVISVDFFISEERRYYERRTLVNMNHPNLFLFLPCPCLFSALVY